MPTAPYLVEVRTGGELKDYFRELIYDVKDTFGVNKAAEPRAVPHITLYGPYNTDQGRTVKRALVDILGNYEVVPYRIKGFGTFPDSHVIYAKVVPSEKLRSMRQKIVRRLSPITYNYPDYDMDEEYQFHITIAYGDIDEEFDSIFEYLDDQYHPEFEPYITRVSNLDGRSIMWEFDLPRSKILTSRAATSKSSWESTLDAFHKLKSPDDHSNLS